MQAKFWTIIVCIVFTKMVPAGTTYTQDTTKINTLVDSARNQALISASNTVELANKILELSNAIDYKYGQTKAYGFLGAAERAKGNYKGSLNYLQKAIEIARNQNNQELIASVYGSLSILYLDLGDFNSGKSYLKKAIALKRTLPNEIRLGASIVNLGVVHLRAGEPDSAYPYLLEARQIFKSNNNSRELIAIDLIGAYFDDIGNFDSAKHYMEEALLFNAAENRYNGLKVGLNNLGAIHYDKELYTDAKNYYLRAISIAQEHDEGGTHFKSLRWLAQCYAKLNQTDSAYYYSSLLDSLSEDFYNTEKLRSIQELQTQYETEKKENRIKTLNMEKEIHEANSKLFLLISGGLGLLLLIAIGLFIIVRQRQRTKFLLKEQEVNALIREQELRSMNAMLEGQENERKRIARDLHDRLGGLLATIKLHFGTIEEQLNDLGVKTQVSYEKTGKMLDEAVQEVRRISHDMISGVLLQFGLSSALKELLQSIETNSTISTKLQILGLENRLPIHQEIALYRIIQELISNTLKHANATQITVQIKRTKELVKLTVSDNGIGFEPKAITKGMGHDNLAIRVKQLDGEYSLNSQPNEGTTFICSFKEAKREEL